MRTSRPGWSLLELVLVIGILGVLIAVLMSVVNKARQAADCNTCLNNLRQLTQAVHSRDDAHHKLPPYSSMTPQTRIFGGWWIYLMPYAEENDLYEKIVSSKGITLPNGNILMMPAVQQNGIRDARFDLLTCPSDPSANDGSKWVGTSNYLANWYVFGNRTQGCYSDPNRFRDIVDGLSKTVLFAEGYSHCNQMVRPALTVCCSHNFGITPLSLPSDDPSYAPNDYTMFQIRPAVRQPGGCDYWRTQTGHATMPVALADGSTRFLQADISPSVWKQLLKPADGGPYAGDW